MTRSALFASYLVATIEWTCLLGGLCALVAYAGYFITRLAVSL